MSILVTGAAGLVGNRVRQILEDRRDRVIAIDCSHGHNTCGPIVQCDLGDVHRLHELVQGGLLGVIHCGALSGPMVARDNPFLMVQVNIVGTANVLELARVQGAARFIYCSSTSAFGPTPAEPVPEDVVMRPTTVYGASKVACEQLVTAYAAQHGLNGTSLRLSWVYGPRRSTDCAIRTMITDARLRQPTRLPFGRDFPRQYIHVDDAAGALVAAFDRTDLPRRVYTVTGDSHMTLGEVATVVRSIFPAADIELGNGPDPVDDYQHRFDISAAKRDLKYAPTHDLPSGIRSYAAWLAALEEQ